MSEPNPSDEIAASLRRMGLIGEGERFEVFELSGGVSCDVWRVELGRGPICVKRALPKLRVTADWHAPVERAGTEVDWFRLVAGIDPRHVPEVLGEDRAHHIFAMEYLPPETYPLWKAQLAAGHADAEFAADVGKALAGIHAATAGRDDIAHDFAHDAQFRALRLDPYLLYTASRHRDLNPRIRALVDSVAGARIALMQGDVSPKNILCGPDGPVFLDAETACYGDPAFDLAFCLNHLLLKCAWHPEYTTAYLKSFDALKRAYFDGATWEEHNALDARAAGLLSAFLLARIDGKSPVEYLTAEPDKDFVRAVARRLLQREELTLDGVHTEWSRALASR